jgi:hypothetical protein
MRYLQPAVEHNVSLGTMEKLLTKLIGDAGEHYVAFELARRGASPAMLSTNTKGADILATISGRKVVSIQVKASAGSNDPRTWAVGKKSTHPSPNFFYVFLNVWSDLIKPIECFIVPSEVVLNSVNWQASMPQFRMKTSAVSLYLNNWELILSELKSE